MMWIIIVPIAIVMLIPLVALVVYSQTKRNFVLGEWKDDDGDEFSIIGAGAGSAILANQAPSQLDPVVGELENVAQIGTCVGIVLDHEEAPS